jgi:primosomal protein N' (replication factor Y) (superfamily II helicase)
VNEPTCVDVVVDVPSAQVDQAYTYLTDGTPPPLGSRVRVPFGGRLVSGWVVSGPLALPGRDGELKPIAAVENAEAQFGAESVHLAAWLRRRYACTFREALAAVAPRALAGAARSRFTFLRPPAAGDRLTGALYRAFGQRPFTTLAASRALARARLRTPAARLQAELNASVRRGVLVRSSVEFGGPARAARALVVVLVDAAAAKGKVQRRLAEALSEAAGRLPLKEARRRASASAEVLRRAHRAGVVRIEEGERAAEEPRSSGAAIFPAFTPTEEQRRAIEQLDGLARVSGGVALLHGVTGSGKTFVYSRLIDRVRSRGGRAIVLVPEIALTPQTAARFVAIFGSQVGVMHSGLSAGDRARVWEDAAAGRLDVIVGARSAVFAPLPELKVVIVDEEHEPSYKQDVAPRYDAAAVARERMRVTGGTVVLGSATPGLETYWEATSGAIAYVPMRTRATAAPLPPVEIVDMTAQRNAGVRRSIGPTLVAAMETALARGEKVMLFVNRRGYAGLLLCRACGFAPRCRRCAVSLVMHAADGSLRCHICGAAFRVPRACPKCGAADLLPYGFGTQRVQEEIAELLPEARIVRMDSDTTGAQGSHGRLLDAFGGDANVLIGTQMIAKGLDFPTVTVVGVVSADIDLNRPDFRAPERTFSLLTQVAGRAGRAAPGSRVVVQTYSPQHYAVRFAADHDYDGFAAKELGLRRELRYPPFGRLAYVGISGVDQQAVSAAAERVARSLRDAALVDVEVLGPAPDPLPKARGEYRARVALKALGENALLTAAARAQGLRRIDGTRLTVVVDPR